MLDPPLVTVFLIYFRNNSGEQNFFIFYESFSIRIYRPLGTIATSLPTGKPVSFLAAENYNIVSRNVKQKTHFFGGVFYL